MKKQKPTLNGIQRIPPSKPISPNRLLISTPTVGTVRMEWVWGRFGQTIPTNFSLADVHQYMNTNAPIGYQLADAENLTAKMCVEGKFQWLCFHGDTLVETIDGEKPIRDIQIGDTVKTHKNRWRKVTEKHVTPMKQGEEINWLRTANSLIKVTQNHPIYIKKGKGYKFVDAGKLNPGDTLLYPYKETKDTLEFNINFNKHGSGYNNLVGGKRNSESIGTVPVDEALARFLGLYLAEGHTNRDGVCWTFHNLEVEYADFINQMSLSLFGRPARKYTTWATQLRIDIKNLSPLFKKWFVDGAKTKRIPEFVFGWNLRNKLAFLMGYLDGDGCDTAGGSTFTTVSEKLATDLHRLIKESGMRSSDVVEDQNKEHMKKDGTIIKGGKIWKCRISADSFRKMKDIMAGTILGEFIEIPLLANEKHRWASNIKDSNVYNIGVEEDHTYVVSAVLCHNCSWEDDNIPPLDALIKINQYMLRGDVPVVSGLYFTRSVPPEPIMYRGMGTGYYADWKMGEKVWVSGVPFGFTLISGKIIKALWDESPEYIVNGQVTRRVFDNPSESYIDPVTGGWMNTSGTSDLAFCKRIMDNKIFTKAGFPEYEGKENPFLVDTTIFVKHQERATGQMYPISLPKDFAEGKITWKDALKSF